MDLETRAMNCLRQGEDDPSVESMARKYACLAVRRLRKENKLDAAARIATKIIDNNLK